jgi:hypothetical protein
VFSVVVMMMMSSKMVCVVSLASTTAAGEELWVPPEDGALAMALDRAAAVAGSVTINLHPGRHRISAPLRFNRCVVGQCDSTSVRLRVGAPDMIMRWSRMLIKTTADSPCYLLLARSHEQGTLWHQDHWSRQRCHHRSCRCR